MTINFKQPNNKINSIRFNGSLVWFKGKRISPGQHLVLSSKDFEQLAENRIRTVDYISVTEGTSYIFAFHLSDELSSIKYECAFVGYDENNNQTDDGSFYNTNGCRSGSCLAKSNTVKIKINIHGKDSATNITPDEVVSMTFDTQSNTYAPAGKNLFNQYNCKFGKYLKGSDGGEVSNALPACISHKIPLDLSKSYTLSGISGEVGSNNKRICFYRVDDSFISAESVAVQDANVPYSLTVTPPEDTAYCKLSINTADTKVMFEEGSKKTAYEPYFEEDWPLG